MTTLQNSSPRRFLGVSFLALLNLAVMVSLRQLPIVAAYGLGGAFFYFLVALVFLIPTAFISAELATGWNRTGGVYIWVKEAFGPGWGFFAVWMQWIHNVTWFPAILSFTATAIAYLINPALAENRLYLVGMILGGFWGFTLFNYFGLRVSSWFSALGVVFGTILPGLFLMGLGVVWVWQGEPLQLSFEWGSLIPPMNIQNIVFLTGLFLSFGGLEVSAAHAREVDQPQKNFPRAIAIAGGLSFFIYVMGALVIALMIPQEKISLVGGLMETFDLFLARFNLSALLIPLGLMIVFGAVGEVNAWIIGPIRSLHATTKHGDLPPIFQKLNPYGTPANLLFFQAVIVTFASLIFLYMPSASSAFWILSAMSAQLYLLMYILMFLAAIKLRYSHPDVPRPYRVPYQKTGIWLFGSVGAVSSLFAFSIGFVPPGQLQVGSLWFYETFLIGGISLMVLIPWLIYRSRNPSWHPEKDEGEEHPPEDLHS